MSDLLGTLRVRSARFPMLPSRLLGSVALGHALPAITPFFYGAC